MSNPFTHLYQGEAGRPGSGGDGAVYLRSLTNNTTLTVVPPDNKGQYAIPRFYHEEVIYFETKCFSASGWMEAMRHRSWCQKPKKNSLSYPLRPLAGDPSFLDCFWTQNPSGLAKRANAILGAPNSGSKTGMGCAIPNLRAAIEML